MAVHSVTISLLGYYRDGSNVPGREFLDPLVITPEDQVASAVSDQGRWATSRVIFDRVRLEDFAGGEEPAEAMHGRLREVLDVITDFLSRRPVEVFESFRGRGLEVEMFIDAWMDQDQMELTLPPPFLAACASRGVGIKVMSNDFSASEAIAGDAI